MMPTETAAPETAAASSESVEPVRRPRGRRKAERPETVIQPEEAPAAAESQATKPEPGPRVGRPAGRKPRQPKDAAGEQMQLLPADQAITDQVNRDANPTAVQEANLTAEQEMAAERSPEAAEAASDQDSTQETADLHRVPPHHTLMPNRPVQRRTRMIGNPEDTGSQPSAESMPTRQPAFGRQQQMPGRGPGRPARPASSGSRPISESSRPNNRPYQPAGSQEPAMLSDTRMNGAESVADEAEADAMAATMPIQPENESEAAKMHRPIVETGDVQAGVLEIMPDGYGFLRKENYLQGNKDIYVPPQYIRRFGLRPGDFISGPVKLQRESDRYQALLYIKDVNGMAPEKMLRRPHFDRLTPIYPDNRFILETVRTELSTRIIDLVAPIGKGQRGMIVSPPKAGKTILLQKIANAISINNPDVKLIVLLIDERPEEVTDMQRSINGEVVYSTFDKTPENHTKVTELVLERAMRLVELKQDVVILLDSMTRLARAYNLTINPTGRTLSGGLDPGALYGPKRFFGAARNIEDGGSLTIIATSLIETGSRMDEVIFEEFKGTGNMEVYLDRKMSEKRIFPAIDINKSGTRREELLMTSKELDAVWTIRKAFSQLENTAVTEAIINLLLKTKNNEHFIASVNVSFNDKNVFEAMRGVRPDAAQNQGQGQGQAGRAGGSGYGSGTGYGGGGYNSNYRRQQTNDDD
jgi:transcription termination factor Rho